MDSDKIALIRTMYVHISQVRANLQRITHDLERRSLIHDESKFSADEFDGFARINKIARENAYGSEAYISSMRQESPTIDLHYSRNSHHPEHWPYQEMSWLDLIEMVCDWRSAYIA